MIIGATASRLAMRIPISEMAMVSSSALWGSPPFEGTPKTFKNGMIPSFAIAWSRRGALEKEDNINKIVATILILFI